MLFKVKNNKSFIHRKKKSKKKKTSKCELMLYSPLC